MEDASATWWKEGGVCKSSCERTQSHAAPCRGPVSAAWVPLQQAPVPDMGVFTKGPADSFWKRWLPPRDEGLVGPWRRVQVMRARGGFCDGERDAGSGGDTRRSSTCIVIREGRGGRAERRSTARHRTALGDRVLRRREEILWLSLGVAQRRRRCGAGGSSFVRLLVGTAWCRRCGAACSIRAPGTKEAVSKTQPGTGRGLFA